VTEDIPLSWLFYALAALLACSGFFSGSETCLMAVNRYRLKHLVREGSQGAKLATQLSIAPTSCSPSSSRATR